ncbi:glycosyltransferase [Aestuariivivens insulae]|uniref:glycosyltransferase n=1 Tax=Aestuariivivens insulae TaxID=1621988 RepID=UPI001F56F937|nr:glycosyltransferase [Aestuariivivens insulae]
MRILLFGEYSGLYNSLKEGLNALGHDVILIARKDGFKAYNVDISLETTFFKKKIPKLIRGLVYRISHFDIGDFEVYYRFFKNKSLLKNYDIVQMINVLPLQIHPIIEKLCLKFIFRNNPKVFLSACGDDYIYVKYLLNSNLEYHVLSPYIKNKKLKNHYKYVLKYTLPSRIKLHKYVFKNVAAIIPTDFDYVMAYRNCAKALPLIPNPINIEKLNYIEPNLSDKIIIFHGINRVNYIKKGNDIFEDALRILLKKHASKLKVITTCSLPYSEYINSYNEAHILLDQIYAYDQGYNALEAMAKGKVVFTGAGQEWLNHYNLNEDTVAINALPDSNKIAEKLEWLVLNPDEIKKISKNARQFIEKEHDYINIVKLYLKTWS